MNELFHRHLVAAYTVTWVFHLCYLGYVALKWREAKKAERE
jgi:cbb3-type cytochrome oxidase subunit 3